MAQLFTGSKFSATNAAGQPLSGGKLYTYQAGTLIPQPTYSDQSGTSPNTNPVILDAAGRASVWFGPYPYRTITKDASDVVMPDGDVDNITVPTAGVELTQPTTDLITGDGLTTVYTLSANPATVNNVFVSLGGAVQTPGTDYTLSGVTLTFTTAPPNGVNGFANYRVALPVGTIDSDNASFLAAGGGAVTRTARDKMRDAINPFDFMTTAQIAQVKANGTTLDLTTALNTAKVAAGSRPLYLSAGTWSISSLSFIGNKGGIIGDGIDVTIIKVRSAVTTALDFYETTDSNPNAGVLKGFTLDCNALATTGIDIRYRHQILLQDLYVTNAVTYAVKEIDTYLARHQNVRFHLGTTGLYLVGSNHSSTFVACTFDGASTTQLKVDVLGTPADGNHALSFFGCDFETSSGTSNAADINCTSLAFHGCFLGDGITSSVLIARGGAISMHGGTLFFGYAAASYGVVTAGATARVVVSGAAINGQSFNNIALLANQSGSGTVTFRDCNYNGVATGTPVLVGDPIGYGPQGTVYAPRLGKSWTGEGFNTTLSSVTTNNSQTFTVLTAPGPTPLLGAKASLASNSLWRDGETLYLLVVYESSKPCNVSLSGAAFGVAPLKSLLSTLPATTGTRATAIGVQVAADSAAYTLLEIIHQSSGVGDTLTIHEVILADSRMLTPGGTVLGNLYKC